MNQPWQFLILSLLMCGAGAAGSGLAAEQPAGGTAAINLQAGAKDWMELLDATDPIVWDHRPSLPELIAANDRHEQRVLTLGLAFYRNHPDDPRRWRAALLAVGASPLYAREFPAFAAGSDPVNYQLSLPRDEQALAVQNKEIAALVEKITASPEASAATKEAAEYRLFFHSFQDMNLAALAQKVTDWAGLSRRFDTHLATYGKFPELDDTLGFRAKDYLEGLRKTAGESEAQAVGRHLLEAASPAVRAAAAVQLNLIATRGKPLEMKFTALDGREVDLAKLRGKVVLVDFWATWCGPCVAEMPNLKRVFDAYHSQGFEVVGISLDHASEEQKLIFFCQANGITWPQYFDGKYWKNRFAVEFGITSIPASFLLDRNGVIVGTGARGAEMERQVRQLLGL